MLAVWWGAGKEILVVCLRLGAGPRVLPRRVPLGCLLRLLNP